MTIATVPMNERTHGRGPIPGAEDYERFDCFGDVLTVLEDIVLRFQRCRDKYDETGKWEGGIPSFDDIGCLSVALADLRDDIGYLTTHADGLEAALLGLRVVREALQAPRPSLNV